MLTFLVATPSDPLNVITTHDGPLASDRMFIVGIRTRINIEKVNQAAISSPFFAEAPLTSCPRTTKTLLPA